VKISHRRKVSLTPQIKGAIKAIDGVVDVQDF
jgi:ribosomal protein L30/L7E